MTDSGQDFELRQGDHHTLTIVVDGKNLTDAAIAWRLDVPGGTDISKSVGDGVTITDAANGVFTVALVPADTAGLGVGRYQHQAVVTDAASVVASVTEGQATINRKIT